MKLQISQSGVFAVHPASGKEEELPVGTLIGDPFEGKIPPFLSGKVLDLDELTPVVNPAPEAPVEPAPVVVSAPPPVVETAKMDAPLAPPEDLIPASKAPSK